MAKQLILSLLVVHAADNREGAYEVYYLHFCYQRCIEQQSGGTKHQRVSRCQAGFTAGLTYLMPVLARK